MAGFKENLRIFYTGQNKRSAALKPRIVQRKKDAALVRKAAAGERIRGTQQLQLANIQADIGHLVRRNFMGARIDNSNSRSNPKRVMRSR